MAIKMNIPFTFRHLTGYRKSIDVDGTTVRECMDDLMRKFPDTREFFNEDNRIAWIALNQELVELTNLDKKVSEDDELSIILIIGGG
jgi:molybdopterin converting factor small subunit